MRFRLNKSCMLLDLGFMTLGCWILSASCCLTSPASCYTAWTSLNHGLRLFDLIFMAPRCWMVSTSCYRTEPSQQYVMFLDVPCIMLWYLILSSRRYAAWSYLIRATFLTFPCFVALCSLYHVSLFSKLVFMVPPLPLVTLLGLPYLMWCRLLFSA